MKKIVTIMLCVLMLFTASPISAFALDDGINSRFNNVNSSDITFQIVNGYAQIDAMYIGYGNATTGARIYVTLEKRTLLVFWNDVDEWEASSSSYADSFVYRYAVSSGTYRAKVRMEIYGTNGSADVIEKELTASC